VRVKVIDPQKYPEFLRRPDNPFTGMKAEERLEDIVAFCARLWARTCQDTERQRLHVTKQVDGQTRAKAA
jgi:nicotinamide mononucleotide adenylyltransferase